MAQPRTRLVGYTGYGLLLGQRKGSLKNNYAASRLAAALIARIWRTKAASWAGKPASFRLPIRAKVSGLPPSSAVIVLLV